MTEKPELGELKGVINDARRIILHVWELLERFERQGYLEVEVTVFHQPITIKIKVPGE